MRKYHWKWTYEKRWSMYPERNLCLARGKSNRPPRADSDPNRLQSAVFDHGQRTFWPRGIFPAFTRQRRKVWNGSLAQGDWDSCHGRCGLFLDAPADQNYTPLERCFFSQQWGSFGMAKGCGGWLAHFSRCKLAEQGKLTLEPIWPTSSCFDNEREQIYCSVEMVQWL